VILDLFWLRLNSNVGLAALLGVGFLLGIGYSRGPRLARTRFIGLVVLNLVFGGVFILGWTASASFAPPHGPQWQQPLAFLPLAAVVGTFVVTLVGIKDITDRDGDLAVGYSSPFVDMVQGHAAMRLRAIAAMPFLLLVGFTLAGLLPLRLLALGAFAPVSALVVEAVLRTNTSRGQMVIRELFYNYWFIFSSAALILFIPRLSLLCGVIGAFGYWVISTRWLHWTEPLTITDIRGFLHTASRGRPRMSAATWRP
jgi:4-hydroxybenzoate polyprenyltransferase